MNFDRLNVLVTRRDWSIFTIFVAILCISGCATKDVAESSDPVSSPILATVVSYEPNTQWDHFDDGSFATYDTLTIELKSSENTENVLLAVSVSPNEIPDHSPFRQPGTRMTFTLDEPISDNVHLAWGALINPTVNH